MAERKFTPESVGRTDPNFSSSTEFYINTRATQGKGPLRIWASVTDTGAGNAMSPALEVLSAKHAVRALAREAGADALDKGVPDLAPVRKHIHPSNRLERMNANVVLTGMASNPTLELLTHKAANEKSIQIAALEDYPGAYGAELKTALTNPQLRPSRLLVMNSWAKETNLAELPWFNPEHVVITGQPAFDYIAHEDPKVMQAQLYAQIGMQEGEELIVWMGQKGGTKEAFEMFIDGLSQVNKDFRLAIRRHPRDRVPMEVYEEMTGSLRSRVVKTDGIPTSEVGAGATRIATIFSTEGLTSVQRQKPTLHFMEPGILALTEVPDIIVPVVEDGSSLVIRESAKSRKVIEEFVNDNASADRLEKMEQWKPDGRAGERVATELVDIAEGRR